MASPSQTARIRTTFQELAALYDLKLCEESLLTFYVAPEGDPAIGPTAYPHRASASEYPGGTLGHHSLEGESVCRAPDEHVQPGLFSGNGVEASALMDAIH